MTRLLAAMLLFPSLALAAWPPVAVTDPVPGATHCALIVDGAQRPDVPVQADGSCRIDVSSLTAGVRRVQIVAVRVSATGREQSQPVPAYNESCALVVKPSTTSFRVGWHRAVTCTQLSGCRSYCP